MEGRPAQACTEPLPVSCILPCRVDTISHMVPVQSLQCHKIIHSIFTQDIIILADYGHLARKYSSMQPKEKPLTVDYSVIYGSLLQFTAYLSESTIVIL